MMKNTDKEMNRNAVMENRKNAELCKTAENVLKESIAVGVANTICLR